jgi:hypothetical protein
MSYGEKDDKKPAKRKAGEPMRDTEFQNIVTTRCQEAVSFIEKNIAPDRTKATEYYHGKLPDVDAGGETDDRSTAV